ncbi:MAG: dethiobiotin synthase [Nitrospinaceae bacterium]|nr:dethiobiotin synthase [Nitrospinaceae bacterium]MBT3433867.1 dethiobiotin synthase [Nitrospinaceae bacterium]MBT3820393.1 dethiobiotin synthase [Nitrospinaceae bacterium]MBT4095431.1 dethiobiotin synthase [Nitrospinaceae bacterium]MBT4429008.1 dethiobiotin synthase [Nitrospinaceae bacterium]
MADPAIFLTGTGTGVGKTVVGCALVSLWASIGRMPRVLKPAESGCEKIDGSLYPLDAVALKQAAGDERPIDEICPYRYALPMAPAHAAEEEGSTPDIAQIEEIVSGLKKQPGPLLVEGAGGLLVPLARGVLMSDLARRCDLKLLIVAPLGLGTLNDTQLTVRAARAEGLSIAGVVLNDLTGEDSPAARRNPCAIEELTGVRLLGVFPRLPEIESEIREGVGVGSRAAKRLREAVGKIDFSSLG